MPGVYEAFMRCVHRRSHPSTGRAGSTWLGPFQRGAGGPRVSGSTVEMDPHTADWERDKDMSSNSSWPWSAGAPSPEKSFPLVLMGNNKTNFVVAAIDQLQVSSKQNSSSNPWQGLSALWCGPLASVPCSSGFLLP